MQLDAHMLTKLVEPRTVAAWTYQKIYRQYPEVSVPTIKLRVSRAEKRIMRLSLDQATRRSFDEHDKRKPLDAVDAIPVLLTIG